MRYEPSSAFRSKLDPKQIFPSAEQAEDEDLKIALALLGMEAVRLHQKGVAQAIHWLSDRLADIPEAAKEPS